ncbi:MAG: hypothetical protein IPN86_04690 [Saprospiraceae bacterium]|nr:hypothetical protein [Saprospiraceae bacterium]
MAQKGSNHVIVDEDGPLRQDIYLKDCTLLIQIFQQVHSREWVIHKVINGLTIFGNTNCSKSIGVSKRLVVQKSKRILIVS